MSKRLRMMSIVLIACGSGSIWCVSRAPAADHRDGPIITDIGQADLNDVYVFQSLSNPSNTVLILTVSPFAGVLSPTVFDEDVSYEFKIDKNEDAKEDTTIRFTFGAPDADGAQAVQMRVTPARGRHIRAGGVTGQTVPIQVGGLLTAGLFDDPFFFDLNGFRNDFQFTGDNFFGPEANILAIVLELPSNLLVRRKPARGRNNSVRSTKIGVWSRTAVEGEQLDRTGLPAVNTVLIPADLKDAFNAGSPKHDRRDFGDEAIATLISLGNSEARARELADFLLPDIMPFDTSSSAGFPNGRRLADDVIDIELNLLSNGAVTTDLTENDSAFRDVFPYLAPANPLESPSE